jgi:mRNA interferase MazF
MRPLPSSKGWHSVTRAIMARLRPVVTIVPATSNTDRIHPFQVLLRGSETGLDRDSKAQVRSVAVERVGTRVGVVPPELLVSLDEALRLHLTL